MTVRRPSAPSLEGLFVLAFGLLGLRLGLRPIGDNSAFVHLRTGIDFVAGRGLPRADPYSFTAAGEPWVVQSWLASAAYGVLERLGGLEAVVVLHGLLYGALGVLLARLARTGVGWRTCATAGAAVGIGAFAWAPRPLAIGLVAFAVMVVVVREQRAAWLLVPVGWVWVNSHGSFVLGGVWLAVLVLAGSRSARRYVPWWLAGIVAGAVNPLGPRLLAFPLTVLTKSENFTRVVEWRAPTFRTPLGIVSLVAIVGAIAILAHGRRRLAAADVATSVVFLGLGLASQRNLAAAAVVLAPVLGAALRRNGAGGPAPAPADDNAGAAGRVNVAFAAVIGATAAVFVVAALTVNEPLDLDGYPVDAVAALPARAGARTATTDLAGCYLILERGRDADVFIDDRYDMYPPQVVDDYVSLFDATPDAPRVLDRYRIDAVLWPRDGALTTVLEASTDEWRRAHRGDDWVVFVRR